MKKTPRGGRHRHERSVEIATDGVRTPRGVGRLAGFCQKALVDAGFDNWRVSILLCTDDRITALNRRYRRRNEATDVLSFPEQEGRKGEPVAGDIALSLDALRRNAAEFNVPENEEMKRLLVHGLLHLAGMDHGRGRGGRMLDLQERLLESLQSEKLYVGRGK
ncbi:MAG: rRNA maturation RNase YbeY [Spirochaetia bacterium]|jgi:probable rRNA maturation factor